MRTLLLAGLIWAHAVPILAVVDGSGNPDTTYAGFHAWYDAGVGINADSPADGDPVSSWLDRTGHGNDLANSGAVDTRPEYQNGAAGGFPALYFDGSDRLDSGSGFAATGGDKTLFVVSRLRAADGGWLLDGEGAGWGGIETGRFAPTISGFIGWYVATDISPLVGSPPDLDVFQVHSIVLSAAATEHFVDGASISSGGGSTKPLTGLVLGTNRADSFPMHGSIAEVLIYDEALGGTDRQAIEAYLVGKYPVQAPPATPAVVDVFDRGAVGNPHLGYRIPSLLATRNGTLLAFAEGRMSIVDDVAENDIVLRRSTDGGATWGPIQILHEEGTDSLNDPLVVEVTQGPKVGRLLLMFDHLSPTGARIRVLSMHSDDEGITWSAPRDVSAQVGGGGPVPGIGIQKRHAPNAGRILMPMAGGGVAYAAWSDDGGTTWNRGAGTAPGNENQMVERADGSLLVSIRAPGVRQFAESFDGGSSWTTSQKQEDLISPAAGVMTPLYSFTDPGDGFAESRLLHTSPDGSNFRTSGRIYISYDGGTSWQPGALLESGKFGYSVLTTLDDHTLGILYERANRTGFTVDVEALSFARISLRELSREEDCFKRNSGGAVCDVCDDGLDNDGDGMIDYPNEIGCFTYFWPIEDPQCSDGVDNGDADFLADWDGAGLGAPDPQCVGAPWQILEDGPLLSCGIGVELVWIVPLLAGLRRRASWART